MIKMNQRTPYISIIIPVYRELDYIEDCLDSVLGLNYPKDRYVIIAVLDKNHDIDMDYKLKKYRTKSLKNRLKIYKSHKRGSAANRNFGVSKADKKSTYFAFTDADCVADKNWLKTLVERMKDAEKTVLRIGCIGGINLTPENSNKFSKLTGEIENTLLGGGGSSQSTLTEKERSVPSIPNCNALYKKEVWLRDKQDESLIIGQDGEFNHRLWKKGFKFLAIPDAKVWHRRPDSLPKYLRKMFRYGKATMLIFGKHREMLRIRWYSFSLLFMMIAALLLVMLSFIKMMFLNILLALIGIYFMMLLITSVKIFFRMGKAYAFYAFFVILMQHISYGLGMLLWWV